MLFVGQTDEELEVAAAPQRPILDPGGGPGGGPTLNDRLFGDTTPVKNRLIFGPSQNPPQEVSQSTLGRPWTDLGLILYAFGVHFRGRFWSYF